MFQNAHSHPTRTTCTSVNVPRHIHTTFCYEYSAANAICCQHHRKLLSEEEYGYDYSVKSVGFWTNLYMPYILWLWQQKIHWESPIFLDQHFFSGFMWHAETIQTKLIRKSTHAPAFNRIWKNYTKKSINQLLCVCTCLTVCLATTSSKETEADYCVIVTPCGNDPCGHCQQCHFTVIQWPPYGNLQNKEDQVVVCIIYMYSYPYGLA